MTPLSNRNHLLITFIIVSSVNYVNCHVMGDMVFKQMIETYEIYIYFAIYAQVEVHIDELKYKYYVVTLSVYATVKLYKE